MDDAAESSRAGARYGNASRYDEDSYEQDGTASVYEEENEQEREQKEKELRLVAKRKRITMLSDLLRELDMMVYMQLITVYHLDCSFFWLAIKAFIHSSLLTPASDPTLDRPPDEPRPFLPMLVFSFCVNLLLHLIYPAPSAGEDTRGYLHGGLMIDLIGQQGPSSKLQLAALDLCILFLQLVMVAVHVKRRDLKKKLAKLSMAVPANSTSSAQAATGAAPVTNANAARGQDADDEERGVLHRADTASDIGADPDEEEDALLLGATETRPSNAHDILISGQCVIGDFALMDTLLEENRNYSAYRLTRTEPSINDMPETLRRLHTLRTRFGVGGA